MAGTDTGDRGVLRQPPEGLHLHRRAPAEDLAVHIDLHWIVSWDLPPGRTHVQGVLPFPCVNLAADYEAGLLVHGPVTSRFEHTLRGRGWAIGTRLRAGSFPGFTGIPAHRIANAEMTPREAFGADGDVLARAVAGAAVDDRLAAVEAFLRARLPAPDPEAEEVGRIVDHMLAEPATTRVAEVAARYGLSPRALQRRFRHYVGVSPKVVLQRSRMHEAVERVEAGEEDGAGLALDLGYSDQAHFINDFRALVGRPPSRYANPKD